MGVAVVAMTTVDAEQGSGAATAGRKIGGWGREILPPVPTLCGFKMKQHHTTSNQHVSLWPHPSRRTATLVHININIYSVHRTILCAYIYTLYVC